LASSLLKKFEFGGSVEADAAAIAKFKLSNKHAGQWKREIFEDRNPLSLFAQPSLVREVVDRLKYDLYRTCEMGDQIDFHEFVKAFDVGPGSSRGASDVDLFSKIGYGPLTASSAGVFALYSELICGSRWERAERQRAALFGEPVLDDSSVLSCVPKNVEISRTIGTEPTVNMLLQKGLDGCILQVLKGRGIIVNHQQPANRELARLGSIDNSFSTIDLSSASDYLSLSLYEYILPPSLFNWACQLRVASTTYKGKTITLNMMSTMGNGFTFSLMTLFFTSLVLAVYNQLNIKPMPPIFVENKFGETELMSAGNYAVFGDDIIVVTEATELLLKCLTELGQKPNLEKSCFKPNNYRESCGGFFLNGQSIKPVFLKRLSSPQDCYVAFNRLSEWSSMYGIPIPRTLRHIIGAVKNQKIVPRFFPLDSGSQLPESCVPQVMYDKMQKLFLSGKEPFWDIAFFSAQKREEKVDRSKIRKRKRLLN
jgi:hypothetical protein